MATVTVISKPVYKLTLSEEEAKYLMRLTQNAYLWDGDIEPDDENAIRTSVFEALHFKGVRV